MAKNRLHIVLGIVLEHIFYILHPPLRHKNSALNTPKVPKNCSKIVVTPPPYAPQKLYKTSTQHAIFQQVACLFCLKTTKKVDILTLNYRNSSIAKLLLHTPQNKIYMAYSCHRYFNWRMFLSSIRICVCV